MYINKHQRVCHNVYTTSCVKGQGQTLWLQLTTPCSMVKIMSPLYLDNCYDLKVNI